MSLTLIKTLIATPGIARFDGRRFPRKNA